MSKDFIKERVGSASIEKAKKQQKQLSYFTKSEIQEDITPSYIEQWVQRNHVTDSYFLNWVKTVFKTDNFLSFFKYYRNPNVASKLVNTRIEKPLRRVFYSEDSYFKYIIRGQEQEDPEDLHCESFQNKLFNALLFSHNDIIIHDLEDFNKPFREFIHIDQVVSLKSSDNKIHQIAYCAEMVQDNEVVKGYVYLDKERYMFYTKDYNELINIPHDLGECPAVYVSKDALADDDVVRRSIFSYVRADLELYVFLSTLQKMTEPNGAIPVITKFKTKDTSKGGVNVGSKEPMSLNQIGGQNSQEVRKQVFGSANSVQAGTITQVPVIKKTDGSIDVDFAKNYLNFFYLPVESLDYLNKRIKEIESGILTAVLGYHTEQNEDAKNELQVKQGYVSREDVLRWLSMSMTVARKKSDYKMLALQYGKESVMVDLFYGSDFFLETQDELYKLFETAPNAIERKNILVRLANSRNKFNPDKSKRDVILYHLMPYASDKDFETALKQQAVDVVDFQLQTRFTYWVSQFEANYGDIVIFWEETETSTSQRILLINNLLRGLIQENVKSLNVIENE